jgi:hypothetical protein
MAKIYPGLGWMMCWGKWDKCEADAKWRHARWALCDDCNANLYYYKGKPRRTPPPDGLIKPRFYTWNPAHAERRLAQRAGEATARLAQPTPVTIRKWLGPRGDD